MKKAVLIGLVMSTMLCLGYAWAGPKMNPGKWEITTKAEMSGMPLQSMTHTQCITNDDLVPVSEDTSQECQITGTRISGDTVSWKMTCSGQDGGGMDGTGQVTYQGNSMYGSMNMTSKPHGAKMRNTFSGRRIGNCDDMAANASEPGQSASGGTVGGVIAKDAKDVGQAARGEAKQSVTDGVREGVRDVIRGLFQ